MPPPQEKMTSVPSVYQLAALFLMSSLGVEGVAVPVLHLHLDAHFLRGVLGALNEAIAEADDRRHVHAADVAQPIRISI